MAFFVLLPALVHPLLLRLLHVAGHASGRALPRIECLVIFSAATRGLGQRVLLAAHVLRLILEVVIYTLVFKTIL